MTDDISAHGCSLSSSSLDTLLLTEESMMTSNQVFLPHPPPLIEDCMSPLSPRIIAQSTVSEIWPDQHLFSPPEYGHGLYHPTYQDLETSAPYPWRSITPIIPSSLPVAEPR